MKMPILKNILSKKISSPFQLLPLLLLTSCGLKPIPSEYNFVEFETEKIELDQMGNEKILIYNGADILHRIDNTGRLNVWINNRALGQIRPREYVILELNKGTHEFKALHIDVVNMRSTHKVEINKNTKVLRIEPTLTSNKLTITDELPKRFNKFKPVESSQ